jgi:type VII secretion-associated serine protease mycosin
MNRFIKYGAGGLVVLFALFVFFGRPERGQAPSHRTAPPAAQGTQVRANFTKINNIRQVDEARNKLDNSEHIVTIHHNSKSKSHYMKREVTVKFNHSPSADELASILRQIDGWHKARHNNTFIFKSNTRSTDDLISFFSKRKDVVFAEPNFLLLPNAVPNDTLYPNYQWNMPMINMERAWDITKGSGDVIIATVDTGVDMRHPEFQGKLVQGYNVLNGSNNPNDDNGHGTHVAGIIAARTNNGEGVAGMNWNSKIMAVKGIGADGSGSSLDIAQGIVWAADHGASVINMSVGNYHPSSALHDAIQYAYSKDVVMVAASGNDNTAQPSYPAAYPEVMSIAAVDSGGKRASFSNYGSQVDIAAPGVDIPSTYIMSDYAALSGTSMACPHAAGLAGLIRSANPTLTNEQVMKVMRTSAHDAGDAGWDQQYGYGIIDVARALEMAGVPRTRDIGQPPAPVANGGFFSWLRNLFSR